jgi:hypothetical protein
MVLLLCHYYACIHPSSLDALFHYSIVVGALRGGGGVNGRKRKFIDMYELVCVGDCQ